ncbi:hypothetical protein BVRB_3g069960 [Beta vulgaris subsp. vulgaris]|nr:hypothetical protein BVRB_3g069960 [Beta vulgaris subsp. vulgaris]
MRVGRGDGGCWLGDGTLRRRKGRQVGGREGDRRRVMMCGGAVRFAKEEREWSCRENDEEEELAEAEAAEIKAKMVEEVSSDDEDDDDEEAASTEPPPENAAEQPVADPST